MNSRQDVMDERISNLEERINSIQVSLDVLPDILTRCIQQQFEFNNFHTTFGQPHGYSSNHSHHQATSGSVTQQGTALSASLKQPIQPQNPQPLALSHQQQPQPSSFQDGDFASLQIASSPSPNNPHISGTALATTTTIMSGQQQKPAASGPYTNQGHVQGMAWQYPQQQQLQNTAAAVPLSTNTNWQPSNPVLPGPATQGQLKQGLQSHISNRPTPSIHPNQNQAALISAPTSSSVITLTPSLSNAPPTNSQLLSTTHHQLQQAPQGQHQHTAPPPAYHIAAQSAGRGTSSNIPTIAPPPPLPPRSQMEPSGKTITSSVTGGGVLDTTSIPTNLTAASHSAFPAQQQESVRARHSQHQDQHSSPNSTS